MKKSPGLRGTSIAACLLIVFSLLRSFCIYSFRGRIPEKVYIDVLVELTYSDSFLSDILRKHCIDERSWRLAARRFSADTVVRRRLKERLVRRALSERFKRQ